MAENLTPEQRARIILDGGPLTLGYDDWQHYQRAIASAIRSAVEAERIEERERCAMDAEAFGAVAVAAYLRSIRSPSKEAANNG